ncbi:putative membrane lipoprotein [Wolffia australiana]
MRIRKNATKILCPLSVSTQSLSFAAEEDAKAAAIAAVEAEKLVCLLNQSPWDALCFAPPPHPAALGLLHKEDDTATFGAAFEGLPTGKQRQEEEEVSGICVIHKTEKKPKGGNKARTTTTTKKKKKKKVAPEAAPSLVCKKTDGKGWQCKREAHHSHSLCEYHLIQVRSYYSNGDDQNPEKKSAETKKTTRRNVSGRRSPQTSDFYYYSGFGPWWGKRRSGADVEKAPPLDDQGGDEEEEMDGGGATVDDAGVDVAGNRRARKPIKARSLMSLL